MYDPFGGAGTTLVEAVKLGAGVVGRDINPVATLTQRQALQAWDFEEVERLFATIETSCRADIDALYITADGLPVLHYFWVAVAICPECGTSVELFSNYVFAKHAYPSRQPVGRAVCPYCHGVCPVDVTTDAKAQCSRCRIVFGLAGPVRGRFMTCAAGHRSEITVALETKAPSRRMYAKMVKTTEGKREYREVDEFDLELYERAGKLLVNTRTEDLITPEGELTDGENTIQALRWGYKTWASFFNDRQLYCLGRIAAALRDVSDSTPEREALIAAFGKTVEHHNNFCSFKGEGTGPVRSIFHNHVLRPERCSVEGHPWGGHGGSGGYAEALLRLRRAHEYKRNPADLVEDAGGITTARGLSAPIGRVIASNWQEFASNPNTAYLLTGDGGKTDIPDGVVTLVVTDPPYMDSVHYSELADFFHAWLRKMSPYDGYPIGPTTRDQREVQNTDPEQFRRMAASVWQECSRVLADDGLLAFSFHQSQTSGWEAVMRSLADADFVVTAVRPVVAEVATSLTKTAAVAPNRIDVIVVCRKSGKRISQITPAQARARVMAALFRLQDAGLTLWRADALSATRAAVLALGTHKPSCDWQELCRTADKQAALAAAELTGENTEEELRQH